MNLPRKDKEGNSYLSYSQISLFKKDREEYRKQYILNEPFTGNAYTDFGSKVGKALELNDFSQGFTQSEQGTLKRVPRLDEFEKEVKLTYPDHGFYVVGYIDTIKSDLSILHDYKTGGKGKEHQYQQPEYTQLCYYSLAIKQQYGILPAKAQVCFIRRGGNAFRGEPLFVMAEEPLLLEVDISLPRLKKVYWETIQIAKEIEEFYLLNK